MRNSKLKVLIIDDDEDDFLITSDYLNEIEHVTIEVEHAPTYKTGVQFVNQWRHDLYIVDYMLGPRNGLELLAEVDAVQARLPIIMLTGTDDEKVDHAALDA
ncbi:MAG: response regulator, partial [Gammaproteobacteria bacterium]|nr:response regulator [Gammaproteobacteria bacterium]